MFRRFQLVAAIAVFVLAATNAGRAADQLQLRVLSSRPDMVTGGDALVRVDLPAGATVAEVKLTVKGVDATKQLKADASGRSLMGLVTGLNNGSNPLAATAAKKGSAKLTVVNHPITGPIFSGPQEQPFVCMTNQFKLQGGGTLGPPLDANCSVATRLDYVYRGTDNKLHPLTDPKNVPADVEMIERPGTRIPEPGSRIPFVIRIETGTINRGIYQIAVVDGGWNGRLIYTFGGGCEPGWYQQGDSTGGIDDPIQLSLGYAVASNSLNVQGNNCGDVSTAETLAMTKEHFIET